MSNHEEQVIDKEAMRKEKIRQYNKAKYAANPEYFKERAKAYRLANLEKVKERKKSHYAANKEIISTKNKEYYTVNSEQIKNTVKAYREANPDKIKTRKKLYRENYREAIKNRKKAYYEQNKEYISVQIRKYRESHKEKIRESRKAYFSQYNILYREALRGKLRAWRQANPDKAAAQNHRRRALIRNASIAPIDYSAIRLRDKMICSICGTKVELCDLSYDHTIPLALGGSHTEDNLHVAHRRCNFRKGAKILPVQIGMVKEALA